MSDYFGYGDNGSLEKLKKLMQQKDAPGKLQMMQPQAPLESAPVEPQPEPGISPEELEQLEKESQMLKEPQANSLSEFLRAKLLGQV